MHRSGSLTVRVMNPVENRSTNNDAMRLGRAGRSNGPHGGMRLAACRSFLATMVSASREFEAATRRINGSFGQPTAVAADEQRPIPEHPDLRTRLQHTRKQF